ncbi:MAG: hypothetical protein RL199_858, partial [Pseudomonadota bacterium]
MRAAALLTMALVLAGLGLARAFLRDTPAKPL